VDEHDAPALGRQRHELVDDGMREAEGVRARVQLDPARARAKSTARLGHGPRRVRVHANQRDEPAVARRARLQHRAVGRGVSRGLVHRDSSARRWPASSSPARISTEVPFTPSGSSAPMWVCASNQSASPSHERPSS